MDHVPSGHFFASSAWLCCAVLAHDLVRWCAFLGGIVDKDELTVTRTLPHPLLLGACAPCQSLGHAEASWSGKWPWANTFIKALGKLRLLDLAPG